MNYQLDCSPQKYSRVYEKNVAMWQEMIHFKEGWRCVKEGHNFEFWSNRTKKLKPYYFFSNGSNGKILRPFQTLWLHVVIKLTSLTCLRYNLTTGISECRLITIWSESIRDYNHHGGLHTKSTWRRCSRSQKVTFKGSIKYWHTHCKERVTFSFSDFSRVPYAFSMHFGWPKVFCSSEEAHVHLRAPLGLLLAVLSSFLAFYHSFSNSCQLSVCMAIFYAMINGPCIRRTGQPKMLAWNMEEWSLAKNKRRRREEGWTRKTRNSWT